MTLAKFRNNSHNLKREIGIAGMIIEFDSIRTAYELLVECVLHSIFGGMDIQSDRLRSSVVERVLRKDEVGSSILPRALCRLISHT